MRKFAHSMSLLAMAGLMVLGSQAARADVKIDTFNDVPGYSVTHSTSPSVVSTPNAIGGEREIVVTKTGGGGTVTAGVNIVPGAFDYSSPFGTTGKALLIWDGPGSSGLGNIDLTQGGVNTGILLNGASDLGAKLILSIFTDASNYSTTMLMLPGGNTLTSFFTPFGTFIPVGSGANFTKVNKITLLFDGSSSPNVDGIVLGDLRATNPAPEPGTMALVGLGGASMLAKLRRRRRDDKQA